MLAEVTASDQIGATRPCITYVTFDDEEAITRALEYNEMFNYYTQDEKFLDEYIDV